MTGDVADRPLRSFAFGPFVLIPERQLLLRGEAPVRVGSRALDILTALVERPGEVVSKRELLARVWPNVIVDEGNLKVNMAALRRSLGDDAGAAGYIATVAGRGYRFVVPVLTDGLSDLASPQGLASERRHNLPIATTRIFGREAAIEAIQRDLHESRMVSIVGAGGIGKTTVALAIAEHALQSTRHGVRLVDLAPLKDPALTPNAIATAVGLAKPSADVLSNVCEYLRDREMLLVLDSCEHIIDAAASCAERILSTAPDVRILVSSREPLRVGGERIRRLQGLDTPPASPLLSAEDALAFPAVQLFVERATDSLESFSLGDAEAGAVAEICRRLDGLPLAIELAATRVDAFSVNSLLRQLDDQFRLLAGHRAGPERHRTLGATIDWSYELLSDSERAVLRRLSTFAGEFSLESACAIAADDHIDRARVVEDLTSLVTKSLVAAKAREAEIGYRLFDTTRSYALDKLVEQDELETGRRRHAMHFLELALAAGAECDRLPMSQWVERHGQKIDDIRGALGWATADPDEAALAVNLTVAAIPFWRQLFLVHECLETVQRVLEARFASHRSESDDLTLRMTLGRALFHTQGSRPEGKAIWIEAFAHAEGANDENSQIECLHWLSNYQGWACEFREVIETAEKMRKLAVSRFDAAAVDAAAMKIGMSLLFLGDLDEARPHLESAIHRSGSPTWSSYAQSFDFDPRVTSLGGMAILQWLQGHADQAIETAQLQRQEAQNSNDDVTLLTAVLQISCPIALEVGDLAAANRLLDCIEDVANRNELKVWNTMITCQRARLLLKQGDESGLHSDNLRLRFSRRKALLARNAVWAGSFSS